MSVPQARLSLADGSWVELGSVLAKAGEGTIYGLAYRGNLVAKVFHPGLADLDEKLAKVAAMVATVPAGAVQVDGFVVLAWPQELVYRDGEPVGFLMRRIDTSGAVEIHSLSNPSNRVNPLPTAPQWTTGATWTHLVTAAANLCLAVDVVHHVDAVIGDFQERNILVADTVRVTLVDCDSMQFTDRDGRQFLSPLGRPEFTAPELVRVDLRNVARDKASDLFALAVHIHLLIMAGNHPFLRGVWSGPGEQPDALTLASRGSWAGGPGSLLHTHPLAPPVSFLPSEIQVLFARAFTEGARDPGARPTAEQWRQALSRIQVISCDGQSRHQIPAGADICPWCDIDAARQARKTAGRNAGPDQVAMPPLGGRPPTSAPSQPSLRPTDVDSPALPIGSVNREPSHAAAIKVAQILVALLIAAGVFAVVATVRTDRHASAPPEWTPFVDAGKQAALNLTTIRSSTVDADVQRILDVATGTFYDDFMQRAEPFKQTVRDAHSASAGTVEGAGIQELDGDTARVLVAITVRTSSAAEPVQDPRSWRMRLRVVHIGGEYKTADVEFVE